MMGLSQDYLVIYYLLPLENRRDNVGMLSACCNPILDLGHLKSRLYTFKAHLNSLFLLKSLMQPKASLEFAMPRKVQIDNVTIRAIVYCTIYSGNYDRITESSTCFSMALIRLWISSLTVEVE